MKPLILVCFLRRLILNLDWFLNLPVNGEENASYLLKLTKQPSSSHESRFDFFLVCLLLRVLLPMKTLFCKVSRISFDLLVTLNKTFGLIEMEFDSSASTVTLSKSKPIDVVSDFGFLVKNSFTFLVHLTYSLFQFLQHFLIFVGLREREDKCNRASCRKCKIKMEP